MPVTMKTNLISVSHDTREIALMQLFCGQFTTQVCHLHVFAVLHWTPKRSPHRSFFCGQFTQLLPLSLTLTSPLQVLMGLFVML